MVGTRSQCYSASRDGSSQYDARVVNPSVSGPLDAVEEDGFDVSIPTPDSAESHASSTSPFTPTPTYFNHALTLKRKWEGAKAGRWQKDEQLWRYSRERLPHEEERNDHGQKLFYCEFCA